MINIVNFKAEKDKRKASFSDPAQHLEHVRDQLTSLSTAFDRLSDMLGDFGTRMNEISERLNAIERKADDKR